MKSPYVLWIEQQAPCSEVHQCISAEGYQLLHAADVTQVVSLCQDYKPALVFIDSAMAQMALPDLVALVHRKLPGAQIISMVDSNQSALASETLQSGAIDYLLKPFFASQVKTSVRNATAMSAGLLVGAMLLDAALGEPRWLWSRWPHPAVLMGRAVGWLESEVTAWIAARGAPLVELWKYRPKREEVAASLKGKPDAQAKLINHITTGPKVKLEDGSEETHPVIKTKNACPVQTPKMCGMVRRRPKFTPLAKSIMLFGPGVTEVAKVKPRRATRRSGVMARQ